MATAQDSLDRALRAVFEVSQSAYSVCVANSFGLPVAKASRDGNNSGTHVDDGDAAVKFGVTADALEKLSRGKANATAVKLERCWLVQQALFPLVLSTELAGSATTAEVDALLAWLPKLAAVLEPVREAAEAQTG